MKKTFERIDKKGRTEEWSWEETPEFVEALTVYRTTVEANAIKLAEL